MKIKYKCSYTIYWFMASEVWLWNKPFSIISVFSIISSKSNIHFKPANGNLITEMQHTHFALKLSVKVFILVLIWQVYAVRLTEGRFVLYPLSLTLNSQCLIFCWSDPPKFDQILWFIKFYCCMIARCHCPGSLSIPGWSPSYPCAAHWNQRSCRRLPWCVSWYGPTTMSQSMLGKGDWGVFVEYCA